jgi:hypothetical protein
MYQQQQQIMPFGWPMIPFVAAQCPDIDVINFRGSGQPGPVGPAGPPGPPGLVSPVKVTQVTTDYTATVTDYFIYVVHGAQVVITLPTSVIGTVYIIKDGDGNASPTTPIIVQGTLQNIDNGTAAITTSFGSITVIFNGSSWSIV